MLKATAALLVTTLTAASVPAQTASTAFTYQGRLTRGGAPYTGTADFRFLLFDAVTGGTQIKTTRSRTGVAVADGVFSVGVDLGNDAFGPDRWLELRARTPAGVGSYVTLSPRQRITATPLALQTHGIRVANNKKVGIGTDDPKARLHVKGNGSFGLKAGSMHHVAFFENTKTTAGGDGVAIQIHANPTTASNNFLTFYNAAGDVKGRVEGFDLDTDNLQLPKIPEFKLEFDFKPGKFPVPSLTASRLAAAALRGGKLATADLDRGTLTKINSFSKGSLPSLKIGPPIDFNKGSLPKLDYTNGSRPGLTFNPGSFPTLDFDPGKHPALNILPGTLPSFGGWKLTPPPKAQIEAWLCYMHEHGLEGMLTFDPLEAAIILLKWDIELLCKNGGVSYGSKGADYAEWLRKRDEKDEFHLGQIVGVRGGKISLDTEGAEQIMAISYAPCVLGNLPAPDEKHLYEKVAFMGQVSVMVRGAVEEGDYILPSGRNDGTGIAVSPEKLRASQLDKTLGRAWQSSKNDIVSLVNVVVGVDDKSHAVIATRQQKQIDELRAENESLLERLEALEAAVSAIAPATAR